MQTEINRYSITLNMLETPITETRVGIKKRVLSSWLFMSEISKMSWVGRGARFTLKMLTTPITETGGRGK